MKKSSVADLAQVVGVEGQTARPSEAVAGEGGVELSFAQQRLWFLDQLDPGGYEYNLPGAYRLLGPLDGEVLRRALSEIVGRHEALRTRFPAVDGRPHRVVDPSAELAMGLVDLSGLAAAEAEAQARRLASEEARRPFDLAAGPLVRVGLIRLGPEDHVLLLSFHHIVSDAWSTGLLLEELAALYQAFVEGRPSPLPELAIQYADFATWQRQWLEGERFQAQLEYWKAQLRGAPRALELPADRPRPPLRSYRGASLDFEISDEVARALRALSRSEQATLFMTLLAAFSALLSRYTGQSDIVVGSPIAGRVRAEIEPLIGFFVNTLILRVDCSDNPSFRELLRRVREVALEAYAHQDLPFEKLVEELAPQRDLSRTPLFQVMFQLLTKAGGASEPDRLGQDLRLEMFSGEHPGVAKFELSLVMVDGDHGLEGVLEYSTDLFEEATAARLLRHLRNLLAAAAADPDRPVFELEVLDQTERYQLLVEWNDTTREYPAEQTVAELFSEQAMGRPEAMAVVCGEEELTYAELEARSNQLAHHLQGLGVGPEVLVGLCLPRGLDMVVSMLGVLKAGGAYLPLDPDYPPARLAFMLEDSAAPVVLTVGAAAASLPPTAARVICLDAVPDAAAIATYPDHPPVSAAKPDNLAYVIYTSGSTGVPKGVAVTHRNVVRLVINTNYAQLLPVDRVAQVASASFDAITFELWATLLHGARLVVVSLDVARSPVELAEEIRAKQITVLHLTTSLFNQLAQDVPAVCGSLRLLLFGGEAAEPRWVTRLLEQGRPGRLVHLYGPTEITAFATWLLVDAVAEGATKVPIGRPVANTKVYILDEHLNPVPVGVSGELYIGGSGLARGYLNRPELTAERFVANPFSAEPGARLYRTGDLTRYRRDGKIEFLGRIDQQVKIRGFRVEPGEVEAALIQHPGVDEAAVVAREDRPGERRLVAYVVAVGEEVPTTSELRAFLRRRLPDYMVPATFVPLAGLPLTPNGKLDRDALPAPEGERPTLEAAYVPPRTPTETILASIWAEVLGVDRVGVEDNFFDLGGHSLLATQVISRIRRSFWAELPLRAIFDTPTIADLAQAVDAEGQKARPNDADPSDLAHTVEVTDRLSEVRLPVSRLLVRLTTHSEQPSLFLIHPAGGTVFCYSELSRHLESMCSVYAIQAPGIDGEQGPLKGIPEIARLYLEAIRPARPEGPLLLGGWSLGAMIAFEMGRQMKVQGEEPSTIILIDPPMPTKMTERVPEEVVQARQFIAQEIALQSDQTPMRYVGEVVEAMIDSAAKYAWQPYDASFLLLLAQETERQSLMARRSSWEAFVGGNLTTKMVPGDHYTCMIHPQVEALSELLQSYIRDGATNQHVGMTRPRHPDPRS